MNLDELIRSFASVTRDPVGIGYRHPGEEAARYIWVNQSFANTFGYSMEDLDRILVHELISPDHLERFFDDVRPAVLSGPGHFTAETEFVGRDGRRFWGSITVTIMPFDDEGGRLSVAVIHDLSKLREREMMAEEALRENAKLLAEAKEMRKRLLGAIDSMETPLAIWDAEWRLVECNRAFCPRLLGRDGRLEPGTHVGDFLGQAANAGQLTDAIGQEEEWVEKALANLSKGMIDDITRYTDGRIFRAVSTRAPNGDTVVYNSDITEFTEQQRELEIKNIQLELARAEANMRALHDDLTGLGNRRFVAEGLSEMLSDRLGAGGEIATLAIDLDRFKQINDTLGHAAGDFVLASVAARLKQAVAPDDVVARVGGDEFIVLRRLTADKESAETLGRRIVTTMSEPFVFEGTELRLGASVGVAETPLSSQDDLLTNADIALYKAKSSGRGAVISFDERDLATMMNAKQLTDEILNAIEKKAFAPVYQPQIDAVTGQVVGLEALARWEHPERGTLSPSEFLQVATDLGVLDDIDGIIFDKAIEACACAFPAGSAPSLSFNVSQDRFLSPTLIKAAKAAIGYGGGIHFELLETIVFEDQDDSFNLQLDTLRELGVGIEIDDFGSGRASIVALEQIAPDRLKIDRRLVAAVADVEISEKLVRAIVDIGRALDIGITAEGVETRRQASLLKTLGCDRLQGYLYGRPMSLERLLETQDFAPAVKRAG